MSVSQSDKYYFPRGDLVLRVENTLFRLHRDILERYSGFFEDMFTMPTSDDTEGTEENPLELPTELCSAQTFTTLCRYLYPQKMAQFPRVLVRNAEEWEAVLKATLTLQMQTTREHIWARLNEDASNIKSNAAKLLRLSLEYEEAPRSFTTTCLRILAYRRRRITPEEVGIMGEKATCLVHQTRERIRESMMTTLYELSRSRPTSTANMGRAEHPDCKRAVFLRLTYNLSDKKTRQVDDMSDIFQLNGHQGLCEYCVPKQSSYVRSFKVALDNFVWSCVNELLSPPTADDSDVVEVQAVPDH